MLGGLGAGEGVIRQTPTTYISNSLANTNSSIVGLSTNTGRVFSSYSNVFMTSSLTVTSNFLMSNAFPSTYHADFYSTVINVYRGDMYLSNTTEVDNWGVSTAPDGVFGLCNTYFTVSNAGITVINPPYNPFAPNFQLNDHSIDLNNFFLNTNIVVGNSDSVSVSSFIHGIQYGGIGIGCNVPSHPIDIKIDPFYSTVYHGAAISLNNGGVRINSDQTGQIVVNSVGETAEATFATATGPLMKYGSGTAARGGYIAASGGDAINIANTGQVSICNAGVAQSTYSLYVSGNTAINGSTIITNGSFTQSNNTLGFHDLYSTSLRIYNASTLHSNLRQQTAQFFCTTMQIYTGDFLISSTTTSLRTANFNGTSLFVNSGNVTFRSTFTMSNSAGTIAANLYSTNVTMFGGNFTQCNRETGTAIYQSTNMTIFNGDFIMNNNRNQSATLISTNLELRDANFTMNNRTSKNATLLSTTIILNSGGLTMGQRQIEVMQLGSTNINLNSGLIDIRNTPITFSNATNQNADFISTNITMSNGNFTMCNNTIQNAIFQSTNMTIRNGFFRMNNNTIQNADFFSTNMTLYNGDFTMCNRATGSAIYQSTNMRIRNGDFTMLNDTTQNATLVSTNLNISSGVLTIVNSEFGEFDSELHSTNLVLFAGKLGIANGGFIMLNDEIHPSTNVDLLSTNINITEGSINVTDGDFLMSNSTERDAEFQSTNIIIQNANFSMLNNETKLFNLFNTNMTLFDGDFIMSPSVTKSAIYQSTNMTIRDGTFEMSNNTVQTATFRSTNMNIFNGNFLLSNTESIIANATFYSTSLSVYGPISTTDTLYCLGRFNSPNVANISTLILGNNIESTAKVSLDVRGTYRTSVQFFSTSGDIQVNGGNIIYVNNGGITLNLPEIDGTDVGIYYTLHCDISASIFLSSVSTNFINTPGNGQFTITKNKALTSIICLGSGRWDAITSA